MERYIQVVEEEYDDRVEIPIEEDNTLLISTLAAQFPGATGLKYKNETTGNWRGVRVSEEKLQPPEGEWSETMVFWVVYPKGHSNAENKRKGEHVFESSGTTAKQKRPASESSHSDLQKTSDLVILGLAYTADENDLKEYFSSYGEVLMTQIKRDHNTQNSKGFGFVRLADYEQQIKVLSQRHMICGRWCEVKLPNSNANRGAADSDVLNRKIFVGRCTEEITQEDLRSYFSKYGEVIDVYIPKPFRAFAFVTFASPQVAASLCGEDHIIANASIHISSADPRANHRDNNSNRGGGGGDNYGNRGNRYNNRGRSASPGPSNNQQMSNGGGHQQGPPGGLGGNNMGNMGGFNMGNFPMNPAMFAALASQGMFSMMGPNGPMGGYGQQQGNGGFNNQPPPPGGNNYNYAGYGGQGFGGYNQAPNTPQGNGSSQPNGNFNSQSGSGSMWGSSGASGDSHKDIKGTAGWSQSQSKPEPMNSSWNQM